MSDEGGGDGREFPTGMGQPRKVYILGHEYVLVDRFDLPRVRGLLQVDNLTTGQRQLEGDLYPFEPIGPIDDKPKGEGR